MPTAEVPFPSEGCLGRCSLLATAATAYITFMYTCIPHFWCENETQKIMSLLARLSSFQHDPSGQVANYSDGLTASFNPAADGGALGDVLNIISSQALDALGAGCRYHSPHAVGTWRYATLAARANLCAATEGWNCIFLDSFPPLPENDLARKRPPGQATGPAELAGRMRCAGSDAALAAHGLSFSWSGPAPDGLCPATCEPDGSNAAQCARDLLAIRCASNGACDAMAAEGLTPLLSPPECTFSGALKASLLALTWQLAPRLQEYVDAARIAALPLEVRRGEANVRSTPYVGVHVRRGDACRCLHGCCWSNADGPGRWCVPTEDYIDLAVLMARSIGARHLLIATEDPSDLAIAANRTRRAGLVPLSHEWRRGAYSAATKANSCRGPRDDGFVRIERAMDSATVDAEGAMLSAAADITLLSEADALVGGVSTFSTLAHRIGFARQQNPLPFVDVGAPAVRQWLEKRWAGKVDLNSGDVSAAAAREQTPSTTVSTSVSARGGTALESAHREEWVGGKSPETTSARLPYSCPNASELAIAFDLDLDGVVSLCEWRFAYQPLQALLRTVSRRKDLTESRLMPGCARLYRCLAIPARPPKHHDDQNGIREGVEAQASHGAKAAAADWQEGEKGEEEVGPALCSRGDLGPFPCLESGCHAHGLAIGCRHLAKGGACDKTFGDVWQRPQGWAARLRVWEACPHACDLCDEPQEAERRPPMMGSCDA